MSGAEKGGLNMNIKDELEAMEERMFSDGLVDTILSSYHQELKSSGGEKIENEYREGMEALAGVLNESQKDNFAQMENQHLEERKYMLKFSFVRGLYAGFEQKFCEKSMDAPFMRLVQLQLQEPEEVLHCDQGYKSNQRNSEMAEHVLRAQLSSANREHLLAVGTAWENRVYAVQRYSFYLGYRFALSVVESVESMNYIDKMVEKVLMTEYELGFTKTCEEREAAEWMRSMREDS